MRGLILLEVCSANPACAPELFELEMSCPAVTVLENDCLSHCALCAVSPYVLLDGEVIEANDVPILLHLLRSRILDAP